MADNFCILTVMKPRENSSRPTVHCFNINLRLQQITQRDLLHAINSFFILLYVHLRKTNCRKLFLYPQKTKWSNSWVLWLYLVFWFWWTIVTPFCVVTFQMNKEEGEYIDGNRQSTYYENYGLYFPTITSDHLVLCDHWYF